MSSIFGPVLSRRFGLSLGVDVTGEGARRCNYDCLYCELAPAKKISVLDSFVEPEIIAKEVEEGVAKNPDIDFITITANGEPTLYPKLYELANLIRGFKGDKKLLILSNGSTINDAKIVETLKLFDVVKLSLDSALTESFKKIDRAGNIGVLELIDGMAAFRGGYGGTFVLETLFVKNVNDSDKDIEALNGAYLKIRPDRIDIGSIDRPPAYRVEGIDERRLKEIRERLDPSLMVSIALRKNSNAKKRAFSKDEILYSLKNRPFTSFDIESLFDDESKKTFIGLLDKGEISEKKVAGTIFYYLR